MHRPPINPAPPAFSLLLAQHQSTLYAAIAALLAGTDGAQDVLQETNVTLLRKASEYDASRPFVPWALAVARFEVLAWRKRRTRDRLVFDDATVAALTDRLASEPPSGDRLDALERCLAKLPAEARRLVDARYSGDESVQSIAARLGRSAGAVSVALFRARQALSDCVRLTLAAEGGR